MRQRPTRAFWCKTPVRATASSAGCACANEFEKSQPLVAEHMTKCSRRVASTMIPRTSPSLPPASPDNPIHEPRRSDRAPRTHRAVTWVCECCCE